MGTRWNRDRGGARVSDPGLMSGIRRAENHAAGWLQAGSGFGKRDDRNPIQAPAGRPRRPTGQKPGSRSHVGRPAKQYTATFPFVKPTMSRVPSSDMSRR
jgi:hypothetical protein